MKTRTTLPPKTAKPKNSHPGQTVMVELKLTTRFNLEHLDPEYKYNSVEVTFGKQVMVTKEQLEAEPINLEKKICESIRAEFERQLDEQIQATIERISANE